MALPLAWTNDKVQTIDEKKRWKPRQLVCLRDRLHARVMDINFNKDTFCVCWKNPFFLFSSNLEILFVSFFKKYISQQYACVSNRACCFFYLTAVPYVPLQKKRFPIKRKKLMGYVYIYTEEKENCVIVDSTHTQRRHFPYLTFSIKKRERLRRAFIETNGSLGSMTSS